MKLGLAHVITSLYHTGEDVENAVRYYETAFSKKLVPDDIPTYELGCEGILMNELVPELIARGMVKSKSEFLRLIKQGGVQLNGEKVADDAQQNVLETIVRKGDVIKIGKKKFLRFI